MRSFDRFAIVVLVSAVLGIAPSVPAVEFVRSDVNRDGAISLSDLSYLAITLQGAGDPLPCPDSADLNDDGAVDIADLALLSSVLFAPGDLPGIAAPFPAAGWDPTPDSLVPCAPASGGWLGSDIDHIWLSAVGGTGPGVFPGQEVALFPLYLTASAPYRGFSVSLAYPGDELSGQAVRLEGSVPGSLDAELVQVEVQETSGPGGQPEGRLTLRVLFELMPPLGGIEAPAGPAQLLGTVEFSVSDALNRGETVHVGFAPTAGVPEIRTELIDASSSSIIPVTTGLLVPVRAAEEFFVRGDANRDGVVDLADAVSFFVRIYSEGDSTGAACPDRLDVDDNGVIDLADGIHLLQFLFDGGLPPAAPFPEPGLDTTEDELGR